MKRRTFLESCALAGLGQALIPAASNAFEEVEVPRSLEIIDCHTHFYDPRRPQGVPWPPRDSPLHRTVLPADLRNVPKFRPVTGTVVVEASSWLEDNQWLLELADEDPFIVGIVGNLSPGDPHFSRNLKRFAVNPLFRGIRISVNALKMALGGEDWEMLRRLADWHLALDVNGGPETPAVIAQLAEKIPELTIVLNHLGNVAITADPPPQNWVQNIQRAAEHENVNAKVSGLVEGASRQGQRAPENLDFYRPYLDVVWEAFGEDRLIYGSNWPVSDRGAPYRILQRMVLQYFTQQGESALTQFCSENSRRVYGWKERPGRVADEF